MWISLVPMVAVVTVAIIAVTSAVQITTETARTDSGAVVAESSPPTVESVLVLDWDAGTADWENITNETVVGEIQLRDPESLETIATVPTGYDPQIALTADGSTLLLAETVAVGLSPVHQLRVFDLSTGIDEIATLLMEDRLLTTADVAPGVVAASDGAAYAFIEGYAGNAYWVDVYDLHGEAFIARVSLPNGCGIATILPLSAETSFVGVCKGPMAAVVLADADGSTTILELDGASEFINGIPAGGASNGIAAATLASDRSVAYVLEKSGMLHVIDVADASEVAVHTLDVGSGVVSSDQVLSLNGLLYVGTSVGDEVFEGRSRMVRIFNTSGFDAEGVIEFSTPMSSLSVSPDGSRVYALDRRTGTLAVMDANSGEHLDLIEDVGMVADFISLR